MTALEKYLGVLDELYAAQARGPLSDDEHATFCIAMNDWREQMTAEEEKQLEQLVLERIRRKASDRLVLPLADGRSKGPLDLLHLPFKVERARRRFIT